VDLQALVAAMSDSRPEERAWAALVIDDVVLARLIRAAEHPRAFDHACRTPPGRWPHPGTPHDALITAVCDRVDDFRRLLEAALAAVELRDFSFAPYLRVAFPEGLTFDEPTPAQDRFAQALTGRDDVWADAARAVFSAAGLPHDRDRWRQVRRHEDPRGSYDSATILVFDNVTRTIRWRPHMWVGVERTDPRLPTAVLEGLRRDGLRTEVQGPLRIAVTGGPDVPQFDAEELVTGGIPRTERHYGLRWAAAFSLWVTVEQWDGGVAYRQRFVDGVPAVPRETLGPTDRDDGFRVVFDLDEEWLPPDASLADAQELRSHLPGTQPSAVEENPDRYGP
jgi:hypothetical protein